MRLVHTSDWHLGRSFHGVGLLGAQEAYVDHLVQLVRAERVEAVLVAGDVYDRALPHPDTVALLSEAATRLVDAGAVVVVTPGNHDSATRLGFGAPLLARAGLHLLTSAASIGTPVVVGGVAVYGVPYLEPQTTADLLGATERSHAAVLTAATARVQADAATRGLPAVVMAHAFVSGGASRSCDTCDSERDISVGGVAMVHPEVLEAVDGLAYVALGHLHGAQRVSERARYSGSPVAMSFSEHRHTKGSWLVDVSADGAARAGRPMVSADFVAAPVERPLAVLRGDLDDLLRDPRHRAAKTSYCLVTLTDPVRPPQALDQVRARFPHTLELRFEPRGAVTSMSTYAAAVGRRSEPLDVCCDFLGHVRAGRGPSDKERTLLGEALEAARVAGARREDGLGGRAADPSAPPSEGSEGAA